LSGRGLCEELITRPEESYRLCCVAVCDLETSRIGAPYIYDISHLRVKSLNEIEMSVPQHTGSQIMNHLRAKNIQHAFFAVPSLDITVTYHLWLTIILLVLVHLLILVGNGFGNAASLPTSSLFQKMFIRCTSSSSDYGLRQLWCTIKY
jgi:hypothetical protein